MERYQTPFRSGYALRQRVADAAGTAGPGWRLGQEPARAGCGNALP